MRDRSTDCFSRPTGSRICVDCGWTFPAFHGASTYLHRPVRIYHGVPESSGLYNYAIAGRDRDCRSWPGIAKWNWSGSHGNRCTPDPDYDWALPR